MQPNGSAAPFSVLLERARSGDAAARREVYDLYYGPLAMRIRSRLASPLRRRYDTSDLAQSVFVEVLRDLERFEDRGEQAFRHWLYIKAENKVREKLRYVLGRRGDRAEMALETDRPLQGSGDTPSSKAAQMEQRDELDARIASLEPDDRRLLLLRVDHGLPFADIAAELGLPTADAARKRYGRLLMLLRGRCRTT